MANPNQQRESGLLKREQLLEALQRANEVISQLSKTITDQAMELKHQTAEILDAIEAEREECAKVAELMPLAAGVEVAAAIRNRGNNA